MILMGYIIGMFIIFIIFYDFFTWLLMWRAIKRQNKYIEYHKNRDYYLSKDYNNGKMTVREASKWLLFDAKVNCYDALKNLEFTPEELKKKNTYKYNVYLAEITVAKALMEQYEKGAS